MKRFIETAITVIIAFIVTLTLNSLIFYIKGLDIEVIKGPIIEINGRNYNKLDIVNSTKHFLMN
jgi:hypothetical protein